MSEVWFILESLGSMFMMFIILPATLFVAFVIFIGGIDKAFTYLTNRIEEDD